MDNIDKLLIQEQYVSQLSPYLERFQVIRYSPFKAAFRCDICGDSQRNKHKRRGGIFEKDHTLFYQCFNCGASHRFDQYLKLYHPDLYQAYLLDVKIKKPKFDGYKEPPKQKKEKNPVDQLLPARHVPRALKYLQDRQIPEDKIDTIYYTPKFYEFVNSVIPGKFTDKALEHDHPRIVIPFIDIMGTCFGVQGRSFDNGEYRYITIMFDEDKKKVYGLDDIDYKHTVYCTEGPLDSMFLPNSIAMAGSDISEIDKNFVIILDNEPRNQAIVSKYDKYIARGHKIFIWPSDIKSKDINDLVLSGMSLSDVLKLIDSHTYSAIKAKIKFKEWRKL